MKIKECKCWECGKKAKWEVHYYITKKDFHSHTFFCSNKCISIFGKRNKNRIERTSTYHVVN